MESMPQPYRERPARLVDGAVVWSRAVGPDEDAMVLPDGCMDLLWVGGRLLVAGPDTRGYRAAAADGPIAGIRFFPGTAPALLGVPAHELLDRRIELAELWSAARVRALSELVEAAPDPRTGLERLAFRRVAETEPPDPLLRPLVRRLRAGDSVAATADELGLGVRRLHRLSLSAFGYGPKMLMRVLRLQRALALVHDGIPFAEAAFRAGYADQAHLSREVRELAGKPLRQLVGRAGQGSAA
ncbi:helix-turn-helix domain-containing protein [Nocardia terpenica]|uniref:AraC family transcriptional regulator n=1 Tax=Nocardia terpenica TaxID=455432 RepID=A0A291RRY5_9NOCA|nr:helix-turn-helix domain-containing protein [Nocardia terpenica]ATL69994.1 AraC family transcriptional regulator [Nocardia terpenica]